MAVRILPGGIPEFDTVEEAIAFQRAQGQLGPVTSAPAAKKSAKTSEVSSELRKEMRALSESMGAQGGYQPGTRSAAKGQDRPVSSAASLSIPTLAKAIGEALGGMESYCPGRRVVLSPQQQVRIAGYKKLSTTELQRLVGEGDSLAAETLQTRLPHEQVLKEMGLTDDSIRALATVLRGEGLLEVVSFTNKFGRSGETLRSVNTNWGPQLNPALVAKAREIAATYGLSCRTRSNPRWGR